MTFFDFAKGRKEDCTTGPGQYNIPSTFGNGPKYSIKGRGKDWTPEYAPKYNRLPSTLSSKGTRLQPKGQKFKSRAYKDDAQPELYDIPTTIGEGPKVAFHIKPKNPVNNNPGPGQYSPKYDDFNPAYSMGVGTRFDFIKDNVIVPPGAYDIPSTLEIKKVGRERPKKKGPAKPKHQKRQHPGPIYNVERPLGSDARKCAFPKGPRDMPIPLTPGPGDYDVQVPFGHSSRLKTQFHYRPKDREADINKAPYYTIPSTIRPKKKSIGSRPSTSYETDSPGPIYDIPSTIKTRSMTIFEWHEEKDPKADIPGPGAYFNTEAPKDQSTDVICPLDMPYDRDIINFKEAASLPGPADYNTPRDGLSKKGFTIKHKYPNDIRPDTAAPYINLGSSLGGYAYTIGDRNA